MDTGVPANFVEAFKIWGAGGGTALLFVLAAELFLRRSEGRRMLPKDGPTNALLFLYGPIFEGLVGNAFLVACLFVVYHFTPLRVEISLWTLPLYFLVGEFCFYWFHRAGHEVRLLWADHSIHHSSPEFDVTTNLRHTPFSTLYRIVCYSPAVLLGFNPALLILFAINSSAFQTFCHTQRLGRLAPWFEKTFVTPYNHGVHHACNPEYIDKNYGGLLVIWDRIFGTYQPMRDDVPPLFGITKPVNSSNPAKITVWEFRHLWRDFRAAPSWRLKLQVIFGRPGYTFEAAKPAALSVAS